MCRRRCCANAFGIGEFGAALVSGHDVFNLTLAIDQASNLPAGFVRERHLLRRCRRDDLMRMRRVGSFSVRRNWFAFSLSVFPTIHRPSSYFFGFRSAASQFVPIYNS
jgi:hypothetical protein